MINQVILLGRLTKDIELQATKNGKKYAKFSLAIKDRFAKDHTDFINCSVWNQSAEYLSNYAHKGDLISLTGRIQSGMIDTLDGRKYFVDVLVDACSIESSKEPKKENSGFTLDEVKADVTELDDGSYSINLDDLPF